MVVKLPCTPEMHAPQQLATLFIVVNPVSLQAIVCVGETLDQRESGELWNVLQAQLDAVADKLSAEDWDGVVVAYEPVRLGNL